MQHARLNKSFAIFDGRAGAHRVKDVPDLPRFVEHRIKGEALRHMAAPESMREWARVQ